MNSLYDFIVKPIGERYANKTKVGNKTLILNTKIESFKYVNKVAEVIEVPRNHFTPIKKGDLVMIHHNVFRRYYDIKGKEKNSRSFFKDNQYLVSPDQIYLYKRNNEWSTIYDICFVTPTKNHREGILKYDNKSLNYLGIKVGDKISFKEKRQFEFLVDGELLYCMKSKDILIKHGRKKDKEKHNNSRAASSGRIDKGSERADCGHRRRCDCGPTKERSCDKEVSNI